MKRRVIFAVMIALFAGAGFSAHAATIDYTKSSVYVETNELQADGIDNAQLSVKIADLFGVGIKGVQVTLTSSRGALDEIAVQSDTTDLFGKAYFRVKSLWRGNSIYTAKVGDVAVQRTASIAYVNGLTMNITPGALIKIPDDSDPSTQSDTAVYYYSKNGKRYVFPNEKAYFTWYTDFQSVQVVPLDQMSMIPIGGNVTYKPGVKLVKFQTDVKTYAIAHGGTLRWLKTEAAAIQFYGTDWAKNVDDISEAFYLNYKFGTPLDETDNYVRSMQADFSQTIDLDKGIQ